MKLTIFTPTFNRAKLLTRLYKSLIAQSDMDFEWIIVDDGSTDETQRIVEGWEKPFVQFKYIKVQNRGKHIAINIGVQEASGKYFFIVDSDDWLLSNAIETLKKLIAETPTTKDYAGFCTNRLYSDGSVNGNPVKYDTLDTDFITYYNKYHYIGDKPSCLRTEVWREFPFPEYENETFCSEALVLRRMAGKYKVRFFNQAVYVMEGYLEGGLTQTLKSHFIKSPSYSTLLFKEQFNISSVSLKYRLATMYNFWKYYLKVKVKSKELRPKGMLKYLGLPVYVGISIIVKITGK